MAFPLSPLPRRRLAGLSLTALLAAAGLVTLSPASLAALPAAAAPPDATPAAGALAPIRALDKALIAIMQAGRTTPFEKRAEMLAPAVDRAFDLQQILRISVGSDWSRFSAQVQSDLLAAFRRYTVASYVDNFDTFDGEHFVEQPVTRPLPGGEQVVLTQIVSRSGSSHQLNYVMRKVGDAWKAVDVLADGSISRVAVQRSDFRHLLDRGGAPALMASLQRKTRDLSRG
ncbi:MAG: ABC transporter substrate-binding protein [Rhodospirillales bacterium]|nr:ABC transporter substrate-binding protein [Rhodospirillales bacterium]